MKLLVRFFIALYIFLLSGHGQLHAASMYRNCLCSSKIYNLDGTIHNGLTNSLQNIECLNYKTTLSKDKVNDKIDTSDNEEDDDELAGLKKLLDVNKYFITAYGGQASGFSHHDLKKSMPSCKLFTNFISQKWYILFRVIRI